jgi:hypothetical protein
VTRPAAIAALALVLAGCAGTHRIPPQAPELVTVRWQRVSQAELEYLCPASARAAHGRGAQLFGCAVELPAGCTIYTTSDVSQALLGHELLHCYIGNFHD